MEREENHSNGQSWLLSQFPTLQDSDGFFERIIQQRPSAGKIAGQLLLLIGLAFVYGLSMGAYHSVVQALTAGFKVAALFVLALIICFPAFYIVQYILGSKLRFHQMISIILSGFILMTAMMVSFLPIVIIFLLTGGNYYFLQLLHIAIFALTGIFGMNTIVRALQYSCEKHAVYPQTGVVVFRFWVVIFAFVAIQLAWNFRPFMGDRGQPFELFRDYEGNFYTALIYSVNKLIDPDEDNAADTTSSSELAPKSKIDYKDTTLLNEMLGQSNPHEDEDNGGH